MNLNQQMYFMWFLIWSTTAKHLQMLENSPEGQRSLASLSSSSSESNTLSLRSTEEEYDPEITITPLSFDAGGEINTWTRNKLRHSNRIMEVLNFQSEYTDSRSDSEIMLSALRNKRHSDLSDNKNVLVSSQSVSSGEQEVSVKETGNNNISGNATQSNETNIDDSPEREAASSANEGSSGNGFEEQSSSSTALGIESNSIQKMLPGKEASRKIDESRSLKKVFLSNRSIVCNDGSQAGFYLRRSISGSKVWVVFLEGGWYCHDRASCRTRWMRLRHLMTSLNWPETRDVNGILSANPVENPYWHDANHVSIPYCSSDTWSGAAPHSAAKDSYHFMGKLIVNQVIRDLVPLGLQNSSWLVLAGSSAGGTGVMLNLDPVQRLLREELGLRKIAVRGISDSGWFLDRTPYSPNTLPAVDAIKKGYALWHGSLPKKCVDLYSQEPWRCYFGYRLYPTIKAPLFVFQWLFDEAQMTADNVGAPVTPQQWDYIHSMGRALRASFENVSAVFAPSCVSHSVLTNRDWLQVKIDNVSVAKALRCWELSTMKKPIRRNSIRPARKLVRSGSTGGNEKTKMNEEIGNRVHNRRRKRKKHSQDNADQDWNLQNRENERLTLLRGDKWRNQFSRSENNRPRSRERFRNNPNRRNPNRRNPNNPKYHSKNPNENKRKSNMPNCSMVNNKRFHPNQKFKSKCDSFTNLRRHGRNKNRFGKARFGHSRNSNNTNGTDAILSQNQDGEYNGQKQRQQRSLMKDTEYESCEHRHLERCSWPQCSHSCPRLLDPYTGEEVHFIDMLKSFGLRMDSVAQALGVDLHTLNNMEHTELLDLLTQQIN